MRYLPIAAILLLLLSCDYYRSTVFSGDEELSPEQLLLEMNDQRRFVSTDVVADRIISGDPSQLLVDVRSPKAHEAWSLPGSVNIPLDELLDDEHSETLDCHKYAIVFFSNGDIEADRAWILNRKTGCRNGYVMKGGLDRWVETILHPEKPGETADQAEHDLYAQRRAACKYFIGASTAMEPEPFVQTKHRPVKKVVPKAKPKPEQVEEEEGC